jgi:hypothetical protein
MIRWERVRVTFTYDTMGEGDEQGASETTLERRANDDEDGGE